MFLSISRLGNVVVVETISGLATFGYFVESGFVGNVVVNINFSKAHRHNKKDENII